MPNHIETNVRIIATPELITKIRTEIRGDELLDGEVVNIDFNKIHPMPEILKTMCTGFNTIDGVQHKIWHKVDGKDVGLTPEELAELTEKYGTASWYDWALKNWGTKWDAYGHCNGCSEDIFSFQTAWAHPYNLMLKLSEKYPEAIFICTYADEDTGHNCGTFAYRNGESVWRDAEEEGEAFAYAFAMAVQNGDTAIESIEDYIEGEDDDSEFVIIAKEAIELLDADEKDPLLELALGIDSDISFLIEK